MVFFFSLVYFLRGCFCKKPESSGTFSVGERRENLQCGLLILLQYCLLFSVGHWSYAHLFRYGSETFGSIRDRRDVTVAGPWVYSYGVIRTCVYSP